MKIIVHAGFHKTGTTTVQKALRLNNTVLRPHLQVVLRPKMINLCEAARVYSKRRDSTNLGLFRIEVAQLAEALDTEDPRPVLLASEDLAGHMPGRHGLRAYTAAPKLLATLAETLAESCPGAQVELFFSTRSADAWLASCYAQHLRATRITDSRGDYIKSHRGSADLNTIVDRIAEASTCPVHRAALEESTTRPLGPLDPLLDLLELPDALRGMLVPSPAANMAPPRSEMDKLLQLNRSTLSAQDLRAAKDMIKRRLR